MTEVEFHFKVPDRLGYACRLLRKAVRRSATVAVTGAPPVLDGLDRALWTFGDDTDFLPHLRLRRGAAAPRRLARTPLWLVDDAEQAEHLPVLVTLGDEGEPAPGFESFERVIEIVSTDAAERDAARLRWRHYASRGYPIRRHEAGGTP